MLGAVLEEFTTRLEVTEIFIVLGSTVMFMDTKVGITVLIAILLDNIDVIIVSVEVPVFIDDVIMLLEPLTN